LTDCPAGQAHCYLHTLLLSYTPTESARVRQHISFIEKLRASPNFSSLFTNVNKLREKADPYPEWDSPAYMAKLNRDAIAAMSQGRC
jgi:hypothetical protein